MKDPYTKEEAYTVEFECESEKASGLLKELASCPTGQALIELINKAEFLPTQVEDAETIKAQAEAEDKERIENEERLKNEGREEVRKKMLEFIKRKFKVEVTDEEITEELHKGDAGESSGEDCAVTGMGHPMLPPA